MLGDFEYVVFKALYAVANAVGVNLGRKNTRFVLTVVHWTKANLQINTF